MGCAGVTDDRQQKVPDFATARAWQKQVVISTPLAYKQVIRDQAT